MIVVRNIQGWPYQVEVPDPEWIDTPLEADPVDIADEMNGIFEY